MINNEEKYLECNDADACCDAADGVGGVGGGGGLLFLSPYFLFPEPDY